MTVNKEEFLYNVSVGSDSTVVAAQIIKTTKFNLKIDFQANNE